ncbi:MAG: hypothetical protein ACK4MJ_08270 [Hylemonella sp.]
MSARSRARIVWLCAAAGLLAGAAWAQPAAPLPDAPAAASRRPEPKVERIRHEDAGSRIDELRVGGENRQISVQPKGAAPSYEVPPQGHNRNPASSEQERSGSGGWKILGF